jgi:surfactin synthase thioesterase subunit
VFGRSAKQVEALPKGVNLLFNDRGVHVTCGDKDEQLSWKRIIKVLKQKDMIVLMSDGTHGYMLMNRILGDKKDEFYQYLVKMTK